MKRDLISKCFRKWSFWQIYGVMMLGAMGAVLCAVSLLSIFFHGRITHDYIISGSIAGSVVGSMIVVILLHFAKMLQTVEQAYKKSEERFKQIAANAGEWIWEVDISGLYTYSSPMVKEMLGYEQEEIVGKKYFYDFFIPEAREAFKKAVFTAFEEREFMSGFVKSNTHKNGNTVILETRGGPIINEDGSLGGYRGVDTDITKRKESEDALKEYVTQTAAVNKELDDFTYIISHDLKEPLRSINAFSKFILEDYSDRLDEEGQRYLTRIQANSYRMQELIEDLLELSRIDRQKNPVEEVDTEQLISEVKIRLEYAIKQKNTDIIIRGRLPKIFCDRIRLTEVFVNLISNAVKFMDKDNPAIEIGCSKKEKFYEFYVKDNGPGIDERYFNKIFVVFQRLGKREDVEGTGAGLSIVKKIVEMHGGEVRVESKVGEGATFYFTIPINKDALKEQTNRGK